jgi:hypothetical protein
VWFRSAPFLHGRRFRSPPSCTRRAGRRPYDALSRSISSAMSRQVSAVSVSPAASADLAQSPHSLRALLAPSRSSISRAVCASACASSSSSITAILGSAAARRFSLGCCSRLARFRRCLRCRRHPLRPPARSASTRISEGRGGCNGRSCRLCAERRPAAARRSAIRLWTCCGEGPGLPRCSAILRGFSGRLLRLEVFRTRRGAAGRRCMVGRYNLMRRTSDICWRTSSSRRRCCRIIPPLCRSRPAGATLSLCC